MCGKRGFTLVELLVVIAIIAILAAILFPVITKAKAKAAETSCKSNMRQIASAFMMYAVDYNGCYPDQSSVLGADAGYLTTFSNENDANAARGLWLSAFGWRCATPQGKPSGMGKVLNKYLKNNDVWKCKAQYKWGSGNSKITDSSYIYKLALMWYAYMHKRPIMNSEAIFPTRAALLYEQGWHGDYTNPCCNFRN